MQKALQLPFLFPLPSTDYFHILLKLQLQALVTRVGVIIIILEINVMASFYGWGSTVS